MSHSPGPWTVGVTKAGYPIVYGPTNRTICRFPNYSHQSFDRAKLIAASPDLLSALQGMLLPHDKGWKVTDWDIRCENAREAISRAT